MRIVTWNVHGARKDSPVWGFLLDLKPDLVLLQEIGTIPISVTEHFHCLMRKAASKTGKPQRFATGVLAEGQIIDQLALSSRYQWVNEQIEFFKGNFINCTVQMPNRSPINVVSVHSPAWPVDKNRLAGLDLSEVKHETNPDVWGTDVLWDALKNTMQPGGT